MFSPKMGKVLYDAPAPGKFKNDIKLKKDKQYLTDIVVVGDYVDFV